MRGQIDPERVALRSEEPRPCDRDGSQPIDLGGLVDVEARKSFYPRAARRVLEFEERVGVMIIEPRLALPVLRPRKIGERLSQISSSRNKLA